VKPNYILLLLNHVVIVVKLCCVEGLMEWKMDVHLISTLVNKSLYYYYYYYFYYYYYYYYYYIDVNRLNIYTY